MLVLALFFELREITNGRRGQRRALASCLKVGRRCRRRHHLSRSSRPPPQSLAFASKIARQSGKSARASKLEKSGGNNNNLEAVALPELAPPPARKANRSARAHKYKHCSHSRAYLKHAPNHIFSPLF